MIHLQSTSVTEETIKLDVAELVKLLNTAASSELVAVIQYKLAAVVVRGNDRESLVSHLLEHALKEGEHWNMLTNRIVELGGVPETNLSKMFNNPNAKYNEPTNPDILVIIDQSLQSEQDAIRLYTKIAEYVNGKDDVTYNMVVSILADEQEHERDFISFKEDINQ